MELTREQGLALLRTYNQESFHLRHAFTVEAVMDWYAHALGYGEEAPFWALAGLLHDIDFERWPEEHCVRPPRCWRRRAPLPPSSTRWCATAGG